jgi:hypothetical protein
MKISYGFRRLMPWMNFQVSVLILILQRTPAPRVVAFLGEILAASPISSFLKAAVVLEGSLGAMHTLAGATTITASTPSPLSATVGVAVASPGVVFGVVGTQAPPSSWSIDAIPPGMNFSGHSAPGTYNVVSQYGTLDGTPTAAGTYTLHLIAYEYNSGTGLATPQFSYTVDVTGGTSPPVFTTQPASQTVNAGASVTLTAAASGATGYQWQLNGTNIPGATNSTLTLSNIGTVQRGSYALVASNTYGSAPSNAATVAVSVGSHLYNISTLGYVGTGSNQNLDAGFYTDGSGTKNIVVRGIGPNLSVVQPKFAGLVLTNPELVLNSASAQLTTNTAWGGGQTLMNAFATVYAAPFQSNSNDTAIFTSVPAGPGVGYTAEVISTNNGTGVAQIEAYDYDSYVGTPASHLINISTRGYVGTGAGTGASQYQFLDAGFWTIGSTSQTVLIRAIGPGEAANFPGQNLAKPSLVLYDSSGGVIASNVGWGNAVVAGNSTVTAGIQPATTAIMNSVYASTIAPGSNDCAMVVTLPANAGYTAEVTSADSVSAGLALVEIYNLP